MKRKLFMGMASLAIALVVVSMVLAQGRGYRRRGYRPRPEIGERKGVPEWKNDQGFEDDVFTFVRVEYWSDWTSGRRYGGGWDTDHPDSDLNFSFRLQQLTSLQTDPNGKVLKLTDDAVFDHPFLYLIEPGAMQLSEPEVTELRRYLLNGGFLMVDDFWGESEWANFYQQIKRVFPDREPVELPLEHEIFHCVYDLKKKPQIPSIYSNWRAGFTDDGRYDAPEPHYRAIFDDKGRMMSIICHNTDLGDGWEREAEDADYFKQFSEKWSYPLGINIVTYAMTH